MMVIWSFNFFGGCKCMFSIAYSLSINIFYVSLNGLLIHQEVVILKLSLLEARPYQSLLPVKNLLPLLSDVHGNCQEQEAMDNVSLPGCLFHTCSTQSIMSFFSIQPVLFQQHDCHFLPRTVSREL